MFLTSNNLFFLVCNIPTRMTTFIKTKLKILDNQRNIDKYSVAANITEYHIISKLIFLRIIIPKDKAIISCKNLCKNVKNQLV